MTLSIQHKSHYAECHYAEYSILFIDMLSVIMLSVVMQSIIMLSVVMLNVIMLSVVAPTSGTPFIATHLRYWINYRKVCCRQSSPKLRAFMASLV
jgi:hypothetical protein